MITKESIEIYRNTPLIAISGIQGLYCNQCKQVMREHSARIIDDYHTWTFTCKCGNLIDIVFSGIQYCGK